MRYRGPVLTLLAIAALAGVLLVVNMRTVADTAARASTPTANVPAANGAGQPDEAGQPNEAEGAGAPEAAPGAPGQAGEQAPEAAPPGDYQGGQAAEPEQAPADQPPAAPQAAPPPAPAQAAYAGRTSGDEATIAIAVDGTAATAYVCDGAQVESWLEGTIENGMLTLQGGDGATVTGSVQDGAVFGMMSVQGMQWPYSAQPAEAPAGLYEGQGTVDGEPARVGWIVLQDGSQVGVADIGGIPRPAPALDPAGPGAVEVGDAVIVPRQVGGTDDVVAPPS